MKAKSLLFLFVLIICVSIVSAKIEILGPFQTTFNLGERISAEVSVFEQNDVSGLFKTSIICGNYTFQYYVVPVTINANSMQKFNVPNLNANANMKGSCILKVTIEDNTGTVIEETTTNSFSVSDALQVSAKTSKETLMPGEKITIYPSVLRGEGYDAEKVNIEIHIDVLKIAEGLNDTSPYTYKLPENIKSKDHLIKITAIDSYGNTGYGEAKFSVDAVPTKIENKLNRREFKPSEEVEITPMLYDQADMLIDDYDMDVVISDPEGKEVYSGSVKSNTALTYNLGEHAIAGDYKTTTLTSSLSQPVKFHVNEYRQITATLDGDKAVIENTGNVLYDETANLYLESKNKKYIVSKKIKLKPGEKIEIDLSEEVPKGDYTLKIEGEKITGQVNTKLSTSEDNRPVITKIASAITGAITGAAVATKEALVKPKVAAIVMILIITGLAIFFYMRDKREKEGVKRMLKKEFE